MNNQPIILNEYGSAILAFEDAWNHESQEQGLINPWHVRMRIIKAHLDGQKINEKMPSDAEFDAYKKAKDLYIAARVRDRFGYDKYLEYCGHCGLEPAQEPGYEPCKVADNQCSFYCWKYNECEE